MRGEELIEVIKNSIAPKICGHEDIKLAVACLLFGGCRKVGVGEGLRKPRQPRV
jgi:DNA replicative helicase MCM subunit Mcm2 (Cdc46/Mcm family)